MAFTRTTFSGNIGAGSGAPASYTYKTADTKAATIASGYFNGVASILVPGDIITAITDTGTTINSVALIVATNSAGTVTTKYITVA